MTRWLAMGVVAVVLGAAGLIRGELPQGGGGKPASGGSLTVVGAYVRAPVPPTQIAAAYFTVINNSDKPDRLTQVSSGAGATTQMHVELGGVMSAIPDVNIPAHGRVVFCTGGSHVMISHLYGQVRAGQTVDLELDFAQAGSIDVAAPVVAVGAPVPVGAHS